MVDIIHGVPSLTAPATAADYRDKQPNLNNRGLFEPFLTIKQAADALGLQYHHLQRGIRRGIFPAYRVASRPRVRLSEIVAVIEASRVGGRK